MQKKTLEGVLLATDLDATLIATNYTVPPRNLEAIERFKEKGGQFTIASGRGVLSARKFVGLVKPNAPCILNNSAIIYDMTIPFRHQRVMKRSRCR